MPAAKLEPRILTGQYVRLEPLEPRHYEGLIAAGADSTLWKYLPIDAEAGYRGKLTAQAAAMAVGEQLVYAVYRLGEGQNAETIVGSAAFMAIAAEHARLEIGTIWYRPEVQGTMVNPETMQLMLETAFEGGFNRVEFKADAKNARSRAALRKLGATEEGILRQHIWLAQGSFRDSVYYSILADEWPALRDRLRRRLAAFG